MTARHIPSLLLTGAAAAALALAPRPAQAQEISGSAALKAEAKISGDSARTIALARVPKGKVQSGELEREHGKLVYSFDIMTPGKSGVEEVNVDAMTGTVVARVHESAAAEKREQAAEKKEHAMHRKTAGAEMRAKSKMAEKPKTAEKPSTAGKPKTAEKPDTTATPKTTATPPTYTPPPAL